MGWDNIANNGFCHGEKVARLHYVDFPPNLEGDVHRVELDLRLLHLDPHLSLEVGRCNSLQLAGSVRCEATPL